MGRTAEEGGAPAAHKLGGTTHRACMDLGRAAEESLISGCGSGTRATCSAVLSGALEAYPPLGTAPAVPGGGGGDWWRVTAYKI
jgi:hypothetical protein